jgi:voltage-gated potassium channel
MLTHLKNCFCFMRGRFAAVLSHPAFLSLTLLGNSVILLGAIALYEVERTANPKIHSLLDTLWWSVATVTTVGYGDISPVTTAGKWVGIALMLTGTTLFCSFTALFAAMLLATEIQSVKRELGEVERDVTSLRQDLRVDETSLDEHLIALESTLRKLTNLRKKKTG